MTPNEMLNKFQNPQMGSTKDAIQNSQFRAEFDDFNIEGLKKFQNAKKYIGPQTVQSKGPPKQELFDHDFLNWDPTSQVSDPIQQFQNVDFDSIGQGTNVQNGGNNDFFDMQPLSKTANPEIDDFFSFGSKPVPQPSPDRSPGPAQPANLQLLSLDLNGDQPLPNHSQDTPQTRPQSQYLFDPFGNPIAQTKVENSNVPAKNELNNFLDINLN